jgi:hypothetical protein
MTTPDHGQTEVAFRSAPALWKVVGEIAPADKDGWYKASRRTVVLVAEDFKEAAALGEGALLHRWAHTPHKARVLSIAPIQVGDDWTVVWPADAA